MWVPSTWETEADLERDLLLMAEYNIEDCRAANPPTEAKIPETIVEYRKRMAQNKLRTLNSDIDESASYIVSGRGRGIRDRIIRPGGIVESDPLDDQELKKQIRTVSGFGYSNGFIEQAIKAKVCDPNTTNDVNSNFKLVSSTSSSSSAKSSAENTPSKKKTTNMTDGNFQLNNDQFPALK